MYANVIDYLGFKPLENIKPQSIECYIEPSSKELNSKELNSKELSSKQEIVSKMGSSKTSDPKVWGPPFWFSLHVSATHYPEQPSPLVKERMKNRILAIPYEIPCGTCRPHAVAFIEKHKEHLDHIVSSRDNLGKFYVDFHNQVNRRYNKPEWTYEQAYKFYSGDTNLTFL